jgi:hypothetical protein
MTTFFGIAFDPVRRLTVISALFQPHLCDIANDRSMITLYMTPETELVFLSSQAQTSLLGLALGYLITYTTSTT